MKPYYKTDTGKLYQGDCIDIMKQLPEKSIQCCVTSPPYWGLRDYGVQGQLGLEETPELFVEKMVSVFREVWRVLRDDGIIWLNLGDSYAAGARDRTKEQIVGKSCKITGKGTLIAGGNQPNKITGILKPKDLVGIPWRVAFALQADGWYLRQDIIWSKPNPMPESVKDRCTKAHEYIFLLSKNKKYHFDHIAIKEPAGDKGNPKAKSAYSFARKTATQGKPGASNQHREDREDIEYYGSRNKRSVWTVSTRPFKEAHFATFPPELITPCILAGCPEGGIVLDPFFGSGTTGLVAHNLDRHFIGIELNIEYCEMAAKRIEAETKQLRLFG